MPYFLVLGGLIMATIKIEKKWFVRFASDFLATQFFGCETEKEVRQKARDFLGAKRLPSGTEIWCNREEVSYEC